MADKILLPELYRKKKKPRKKLMRRGNVFSKFMFMLLVVLAVSGLLFTFSDVGGNIALSIAQNFLLENYGAGLRVGKISGNPIRGYTLHDFGITDRASSRDIFSAGFLSARMNLPAMLTGNLRISEISIGGISMDAGQFISAVNTLSLPKNPASYDSLPHMPFDRFTITDSHIHSSFAVFDVNRITADMGNLDVNVDGAVNGLPLRGSVDMDGLAAVNRSELLLGTGKIIATGGYEGDNLDVHMSAEDFDLKELASLYPGILNSGDFDGKADFTADITGTPSSPKLMGSISCKGSEIYGYPVERASANISCSSRRISVSNIQASSLGIPIQGEIEAVMTAGRPAYITVKLDGSESGLNDMDEILGIPGLKALSGKVSVFSVNIRGYTDKPNGIVSFSAPKISYDGREMTDIRVQLKLADSNTAQVEGKFMFEGAHGYISGSIGSFLTTPNMNLAAKIAGLDIKRVETFIADAPRHRLAGKITASLSVKGTASNPDVTGSINSDEFSGLGCTITKPAVNFVFTDRKLVLTKTEGSLNGMPVSITGTISPIPSENPKLNINATITMTPEAFKAYVPDIDSLNLKGRVNAGVKITGYANNPSVNLLATSPSLQAMDIVSAKNLELTTSLDGDTADMGKGGNFSVNVAAESITSCGVALTGANARVSRNGDEIALEGFSARSGEGMVTGAGTATLSGKKPLDFSFMFSDIAIETLAESSDAGIEGKLSGTLNLSGSNDNPAISLKAGIPSLKVRGFELDNINADLSGNAGRIELKNLRANAWGSEVNAAGYIQLNHEPGISVTVTGRSVNLARVFREIPAMRGNVSGTAGVDVSISVSSEDISAEGTLTASSLTLFGLKLSDVNMPLSFKRNIFASYGGIAKLYGGTLRNNIDFNAYTREFDDDIEVESADMAGLLHDMPGGLGGTISGLGRLSFRVTGSLNGVPEYEGGGELSLERGALTGFKWLGMFTGRRDEGIRYESVIVPVMLQTGRLIIQAGAEAEAYQDDALYRYVRLPEDGIIDFRGGKMSVDIAGEGNVNYSLASGGIDVLVREGVAGMLKKAVSFMRGGMTEALNALSGDFRTVTLRVHGKADSLEVSDLKISEAAPKPRPNKPRSRPRPKPQARRQPARHKASGQSGRSTPEDPKKIDLSNSHRILRIWGSGNQE